MAYDDSLSLDLRDIEPFIKDYKATKATWEAALRSTLNKLSKVMNVSTRQALSRELRMNGRDLKKRMYRRDARHRTNGVFSSVWYGTNPVSLQYLHPTQTGAGVKTKTTGLVPHAFIREDRHGNKIVFQRQGAKHTAPASKNFSGKNAGQLKQPLLKVEAPIHDKVDDYLQLRALGGRELREQFFELFDDELLKRWGRRNA